MPCLVALIVLCLQIGSMFLIDNNVILGVGLLPSCGIIVFIGSTLVILKLKVIGLISALPIMFKGVKMIFFRFKETTRSFSNECLGTTRPVTPIDSSDFALDIRMPGVTPKEVRGTLYFIILLFCVLSKIEA